jgi:hypothetical protein
VPKVISDEFRDFHHWYFVACESSFFGCNEVFVERPALLRCEHVEAARIGGSEDFVSCVGSFATTWSYKILGP